MKSIMGHQRILHIHTGREGWKEYHHLRATLVRIYLGTRSALLIATALAASYVIFASWRVVVGEIFLTWTYLLLVSLTALLLFGVGFLVGLMLLPVFAFLYRDMIGIVYIERCGTLMDEKPHTFDEPMLKLVGEFAGTNSGVEWGATSVFGVLFAVALALLTPNIQEQLTTEWQILSWAFAGAMLLGCILSAVVASADAVIRNVVAIRLTLPTKVPLHHSAKSPWFSR